MVTTTFVPGYLGTVTINSEDLSAVGQVMRLNLGRNTLNKPVFGSAYGRALGGQRSGTFSASGHIAAEKVAALVSIFNEDAPVDFSMQIGEAAGATDGGVLNGQCVVTGFTIEADADGEWEWSIDAATDGSVPHTAPGE